MKFRYFDPTKFNWYERDANPEELAYINAWEKIQDWVRDNIDIGKAEDIQFEWKHEVYYKISFCVHADQDGKSRAYIMKGNHGYKYDDFVDAPASVCSEHCHMSYKKGDSEIDAKSYGMITDVVDDWQTIKSILIDKVEHIKSVFDFAP